LIRLRVWGRDLLEHVVVGAAREHELARVQLEEAHADRPGVGLEIQSWYKMERKR
jgi:hypothetical protein